MVSSPLDINTTERKLMNFNTLGIPHLYSLGQVELLRSNEPLEPHIHRDCFEICYHYDGRQYYEIEGEGYETQGGNIFIAFPNEVHGTGNMGEEKSKFFYIIFNCMPDTQNFMGLDDDASNYIRDTLFSIEDRVYDGNVAIGNTMSEMLSIYFSDSPFRKSLITARSIDLFYQITKIIGECRTKENKEPEDIQYIMDLIERHPHENLSIDELANAINLSASHFKKKFKHTTGFTPYDYQLRYKISFSKDMLKHTHMTMAEIAQELGFSSSQHFSSTFKKYTGRTPSEYRKSNRGIKYSLG